MSSNCAANAVSMTAAGPIVIIQVTTGPVCRHCARAPFSDRSRDGHLTASVDEGGDAPKLRALLAAPRRWLRWGGTQSRRVLGSGAELAERCRQTWRQRRGDVLASLLQASIGIAGLAVYFAFRAKQGDGELDWIGDAVRAAGLGLVDAACQCGCMALEPGEALWSV